jgi:Uma2 family endonuclease
MPTLDIEKRPGRTRGTKPHPERRMTEEEFVAWCDGQTRAEWADGDVVVMAPNNLDHIESSDFLVELMRGFVRRKNLGRCFSSGLHVRLSSPPRRREPDLLFVDVKRLDIIKKTHIEGAPDLVVEIVSPESESRDWREKFFEYEAAGVREYWIVDPASQRVEIYALDKKGKYQTQPEKEGRIASKVLKGFYLKPAWLWQKPEPDVIALLKELGAL